MAEIEIKQWADGSITEAESKELARINKLLEKPTCGTTTNYGSSPTITLRSLQADLAEALVIPKGYMTATEVMMRRREMNVYGSGFGLCQPARDPVLRKTVNSRIVPLPALPAGECIDT
jgi:hypothetical protein